MFKPVVLGQGALPPGPEPGAGYDADSLFWRHERLHRLALRDYQRLQAVFAEERRTLQDGLLASGHTLEASRRAFADHRAAIVTRKALLRWTERVERGGADAVSDVLELSRRVGCRAKLPGFHGRWTMIVERKRAQIRIAGKVQGVFFRASTREQARARGLAGWVKNMPDGTVEAVLEGPAEDVEEVVEWAHEGPRAARVDTIDVDWLEPQGDVQTFEVRR